MQYLKKNLRYSIVTNQLCNSSKTSSNPASNNNNRISTERALGNCSNPSKKKILDLAGTLKHHNNSRRMYSSSNNNNLRWHPMLMLLSTGATLLAKAMLKHSSIKITALNNSNMIISSTTKSNSKNQFNLKSNMLITMQIQAPQSTINKIKTINIKKISLKRKTHKKSKRKQSRNLMMLELIAVEAGFSRACSTSLVELPQVRVKTKPKLKSPLKNLLSL